MRDEKGKWIPNGHHQKNAIHETELTDGSMYGCRQPLERIPKSEFEIFGMNHPAHQQNQGYDWVLVCRSCHIDDALWRKRIEDEGQSIRTLIDLTSKGIINSDQFTKGMVEIIGRVEQHERTGDKNE